MSAFKTPENLFKPEHLGNCNMEILAESFGEGRVTRLVCAGHCWVVARHQKKKCLADMWRQGPDVERSQGRVGSVPPRGEQRGNGPLCNMQQSHPWIPMTATQSSLPCVCPLSHDDLHFTVEKIGAQRGYPTNKRSSPESNTVALAPEPAFFPLPHVALKAGCWRRTVIRR